MVQATLVPIFWFTLCNFESELAFYLAVGSGQILERQRFDDPVPDADMEYSNEYADYSDAEESQEEDWMSTDASAFGEEAEWSGADVSASDEEEEWPGADVCDEEEQHVLDFGSDEEERRSDGDSASPTHSSELRSYQDEEEVASQIQDTAGEVTSRPDR